MLRITETIINEIQEYKDRCDRYPFYFGYGGHADFYVDYQFTSKGLLVGCYFFEPDSDPEAERLDNSVGIYWTEQQKKEAYG